MDPGPTGGPATLGFYYSGIKLPPWSGRRQAPVDEAGDVRRAQGQEGYSLIGGAAIYHTLILLSR